MKPISIEAYNLLHDGILAFARAEQQGIRIDVDYCQQTQERLTRRITAYENEFKESNFYKHWHHYYNKNTNIRSNTQLSNLLYNVRGIKIPKTTDSGQGATDEDTLRQLGIPEIDPLLSSKKLIKLRDVYIDGWLREQVNGYVHPFFNLHLARTYRSSCGNPNVQNVPKRDEESMYIVRKAIYPRPGHIFGEADFGAAEVRTSVCYNKDKNLRNYILDPTTDMHRDEAIELFMLSNYDKKTEGHYTLRQAAKNGFVFPEFYGDFYESCARYLAVEWGKLPLTQEWKSGMGIKIGDTYLADHLISKKLGSLEKFAQHVKKVEDFFWNKRFYGYKKWKDIFFAEYQQNGYFDTYTGFRCSGVMKKKEVCNYPIQGSAFHCLLWCFNRVDQIAREEKWDTKLIGQVHDSMLLDIHPAELEHVYWTIKRVVEEELLAHWRWITVPMEIEFEISDVDTSWADKKDYELAA
jgi:DNA polymerase I-like protein with 3'-5' exonuclease and polymerase domains